MKVLHLCLSGFFMDDSLYQDNELVREHLVAGHDVMVIASTEILNPDGKITYDTPRDYVTREGARILRVPYSRGLPLALAKKIRSYPGIYDHIARFAPDVIMFHGASAWELRNVTRYVRDHPEVIFHIDSHADATNSGHGFLSLELLHRRFYAPILRKALPYSGPLLCVATSVMDFANDVYRVPADQLEFYPLGGKIIDATASADNRRRVRQRLGIDEAAIMIVQSGKQGRAKKLLQSLRTFSQVPNPNMRLVIAGTLQDDIRAECEALIAADPRVTFLGWQDADSLTDLLCAADIYLQPGTQSATMQHSLCCGCAVILDDVPSHHPYIEGNGWLVRSQSDLQRVLLDLAHVDISAYQTASLSLAAEKLDYKRLAARLLV